ncbi:alsin [Anaeramoeba flamelloides]|uniref:Alsin n=1 Tax=Anaeramoeba flamelloides TaxID=1746091 RepID=A0AAV7YDT7_9EUKA|nr:alsin [Anaeramoeba flamelloides]
MLITIYSTNLHGTSKKIDYKMAVFLKLFFTSLEPLGFIVLQRAIFTTKHILLFTSNSIIFEKYTEKNFELLHRQVDNNFQKGSFQQYSYSDVCQILIDNNKLVIKFQKSQPISFEHDSKLYIANELSIRCDLFNKRFVNNESNKENMLIRKAIFPAIPKKHFGSFFENEKEEKKKILFFNNKTNKEELFQELKEELESYQKKTSNKKKEKESSFENGSEISEEEEEEEEDEEKVENKTILENRKEIKLLDKNNLSSGSGSESGNETKDKNKNEKENQNDEENENEKEKENHNVNKKGRKNLNISKTEKDKFKDVHDFFNRYFVLLTSKCQNKKIHSFDEYLKNDFTIENYLNPFCDTSETSEEIQNMNLDHNNTRSNNTLHNLSVTGNNKKNNADHNHKDNNKKSSVQKYSFDEYKKKISKFEFFNCSFRYNLCINNLDFFQIKIILNEIIFQKDQSIFNTIIEFYKNFSIEGNNYERKKQFILNNKKKLLERIINNHFSEFLILLKYKYNKNKARRIILKIINDRLIELLVIPQYTKLIKIFDSKSKFEKEKNNMIKEYFKNNITQENVKIPVKLISKLKYKNARNYIKKICNVSLPIKKLKIFSKIGDLITQEVENQNLKISSLNTDAYISIFLYIILKTDIPNFYFHCTYTENFVDSAYLKEKEGFFLVNILTAVNYILNHASIEN